MFKIENERGLADKSSEYCFFPTVYNFNVLHKPLSTLAAILRSEIVIFPKTVNLLVSIKFGRFEN